MIHLVELKESTQVVDDLAWPYDFDLIRTNADSSWITLKPQAVGVVVGTLEVDLLWPLYKMHPNLEPESLKNWETRS